MACATPLDVKGGETITLEPASTHALIRDLVVDFSHPLEGVKRQGK
jgi:succinate dehydrogenase/fumarate reductase-like Fe-S protein